MIENRIKNKNVGLGSQRRRPGNEERQKSRRKKNAGPAG